MKRCNFPEQPEPPEPPKSRKVIEGSITPKTIKIFFVILAFMCAFMAWGMNSYVPNDWKATKTNFLRPFTIEVKVPVEVEKKVPVEVEKIKWMEHIKMPTELFIEHLKPSLDPDVAKKIALAVDVYSKEHQLPKKLILSIIFKESSFNIFAKSKAGAIGLMQVIPKYHQDKIDEMGIIDNRKLYYIDNNINLGCKIWRTYYDISKKDLDETFHRYLSKNATEDAKNKYKGVILETWARLEFLEFQYENGYGKEKKNEGNDTISNRNES